VIHVIEMIFVIEVQRDEFFYPENPFHPVNHG